MVWTPQVRPLSRACAVRADPACLQSAVSCRLVSSRGVRRSLRRPYHLVPYLSGRHLHRSGAPDRLRWRPTRPARLTDLLALYLDLAGSHRRLPAPGMVPIVSGAVDNVCAVPNDLDASRRHFLLDHHWGGLSCSSSLWGAPPASGLYMRRIRCARCDRFGLDMAVRLGELIFSLSIF